MSDLQVELTHDDPEYREAVEEELERLRDKGLLEGLQQITDDPDAFRGSVDGRHSGRYNPETDALYIAPEEVLGPSKGREGYFSTEANMGSIWHELAHHRIREENPGKTFEAGPGEDYWGDDIWHRFAVEEVMGWDWERSQDPLSLRRARANLFERIEETVSEYASFGPMAAALFGLTCCLVYFVLWNERHGTPLYG